VSVKVTMPIGSQPKLPIVRDREVWTRLAYEVLKTYEVKILADDETMQEIAEEIVAGITKDRLKNWDLAWLKVQARAEERAAAKQEEE